MRLSKRRRTTIADMNMTPMIDIVFLLLIFFMTVSQVSEANKVRLELPKLEGEEELKPATITINVDAEEKIIVTGRTLELADLISLVSAELQRVGDDPSRVNVVIRADRNGKSGPVNRIVSALGRMQIKRVKIRVHKER